MINDPVAPTPSKSTSSRRNPSWAAPVGTVVYNLVVHRARLRRAARHAGDPEAAQRLRRLARRRKSDVEAIVRTAPPEVISPEPVPADAVAPHAARQLALANEIASLAAALRSNRKVRVAIERASAKSPPAAVESKLSRLAEDLEVEAGTLNRQLSEVAVVDFGRAGTTSTSSAGKTSTS